MQRALELARGVMGTTSPNPAVGAVLVKDGRVVGEGATQRPGGDHAEVVALKQAGEAARGTTMYVTLEPHCFQGRTPPCSQAIIRAGVAEVHIATLDDNPRVAGRGKAELEAAGVRVALGERSDEAREAIEGHSKWVTTRLPFVTVKYAMTLDGKIATVSGESRWISGPESRTQVHVLRRTSDAIMVGVNTALRDDPQLTARDAEGRPLPRQPLRVVVDTNGRLPATAQMLRQPGRTLVAVAGAPKERQEMLRRTSADVLDVPQKDGRVDLAALLAELGRQEVVSLLVEGGGTLLAQLFSQGLVDKVLAYIAPLILGGAAAPTPVEGEGIASLGQAVRLERVRVERVGDDVLLVGYPKR
ncbi:MAG: bifunctional diaminohydroxyphosphoribosylaminopyrimidine deaminase/5-amino-6-(5-phosphoribosylamino)uracil reductase RibD [Dehalococcoidia bacterium]|nr:bifunctional diaminohydroxyphosphoribosylaminopyrimidine deaminase/5-amino-6-(5-phosphoribosylamino)uracil reductase RibD [Dehalococcoidia bacterium]